MSHEVFKVLEEYVVLDDVFEGWPGVIEHAVPESTQQSLSVYDRIEANHLRRCHVMKANERVTTAVQALRIGKYFFIRESLKNVLKPRKKPYSLGARSIQIPVGIGAEIVIAQLEHVESLSAELIARAHRIHVQRAETRAQIVVLGARQILTKAHVRGQLLSE